MQKLSNFDDRISKADELSSMYSKVRAILFNMPANAGEIIGLYLLNIMAFRAGVSNNHQDAEQSAEAVKQHLGMAIYRKDIPQSDASLVLKFALKLLNSEASEISAKVKESRKVEDSSLYLIVDVGKEECLVDIYVTEDTRIVHVLDMCQGMRVNVMFLWRSVVSYISKELNIDESYSWLFYTGNGDIYNYERGFIEPERLSGTDNTLEAFVKVMESNNHHHRR